jgi:hypothetical protein
MSKEQVSMSNGSANRRLVLFPLPLLFVHCYLLFDNTAAYAAQIQAKEIKMKKLVLFFALATLVSLTVSAQMFTVDIKKGKITYVFDEPNIDGTHTTWGFSEALKYGWTSC